LSILVFEIQNAKYFQSFVINIESNNTKYFYMLNCMKYKIQLSNIIFQMYFKCTQQGWQEKNEWKKTTMDYGFYWSGVYPLE